MFCEMHRRQITPAGGECRRCGHALVRHESRARLPDGQVTPSAFTTHDSPIASPAFPTADDFLALRWRFPYDRSGSENLAESNRHLPIRNGCK
jgi:hypothetical protein